MPGLSSISSKPYHYGSHYSNSGIVLHFLVRIPPFTDMFLDFQGKGIGRRERERDSCYMIGFYRNNLNLTFIFYMFLYGIFHFRQ